MAKKMAKKWVKGQETKVAPTTWESAIAKLTMAELRAVLIKMFNVALPDPEISYDPGVDSGMEDAVSAIVTDWLNACFGVSFTHAEVLRLVRVDDNNYYTSAELADLLIKAAVERRNEPEWTRIARKEGWTPPERDA